MNTFDSCYFTLLMLFFRKFYWRSGNYIKTLLITLHFCRTCTLQLLPHANNYFVEDLHKKMLQHLSDLFIYEACNTKIFQRHLQIRHIPPVSHHSICLHWYLWQTMAMHKNPTWKQTDLMDRSSLWKKKKISKIPDIPWTRITGAKYDTIRK